MKVRVEQKTAIEQKTDLLVVGAFQEEKSPLPSMKLTDNAMNGYLSTILKDENFEGKFGQQILVHAHGQVPAVRVAVVGLGKKQDCTLEQMRRMAATVIKSAQTVKVDSVSFALDGVYTKKLTPELVAQAVVEGAQLAVYSFLKYKGAEAQKEAKKVKIHSMVLIDADAARVKKLKHGVQRGERYAQATMFVRDMVNEPALEMKPKDIAKAATELGKKPGITTKVYTEAEIKKMKMGAFLSVAAGSDEPPYFIHLTYKPKKKGTGKRHKIALCGKGITFDSGGLSLKPSPYMESMKIDMAGAALILGVFSQLVELQPDVEVHGVIPATENMPSGKATRPGDVVTAYDGTTIEVLNTDAEGRMILADALSWTEKNIQPDVILDFATLTGAAVVALGQEVAALLGTDEQMMDLFWDATEDTGEQIWELPLVEEYRELLKSPIADLQNVSKISWAGTIMAALFLQHFVKDTPWMHLDIAGPAWVERQVLPYAPMGASGYGVRTVLNFLETYK